MIIEIDFNSDEALYLQVCHQIIMGIAMQQLQEGDPLPSVRALAENIGINMHTVNKAYTVLRQEGYVQVDRRRGVVVALNADKLAALQELSRSLQVVLAKAYCNNITKQEVYELVDMIYAKMEK